MLEKYKKELFELTNNKRFLEFENLESLIDYMRNEINVRQYEDSRLLKLFNQIEITLCLNN